MPTDHDNQRTTLQRAQTLLRRVLSQYSSRDGFGFGPRFDGDLTELADALGELGHKSLGRRLKREGLGARKWWSEAYGHVAFLKRFRPGHDQELNAAAAAHRCAVFVERLTEVVNAVQQRSELHCNRANVEFEEQKLRLQLLAKAYTQSRAHPTPADVGRGGAGAATAGYEGYAPADTIRLEHGILKPRLSEGKKAGKIKSKPAPAGIKDTEGRAVRVYYHVADALAYCKPQHRQDKARTRKCRPL